MVKSVVWSVGGATSEDDSEGGLVREGGNIRSVGGGGAICTDTAKFEGGAVFGAGTSI